MLQSINNIKNIKIIDIIYQKYKCKSIGIGNENMYMLFLLYDYFILVIFLIINTDIFLFNINKKMIKKLLMFNIYLII